MKRYFLVLLPLLAACATTPPPPPAPIIVQAPPPKPIIPDDPYLTLPSDIAEAIKHNETPTLQHGNVTIYPWSNTRPYNVNCQPLFATQIRLAPGEFVTDNDVILGDSDRWAKTTGDGVVLVKPLRTTQTVISQGPQPEIHPAAPNMQTNLLIHGSQHDYTLELRIRKPLTEVVSFYYSSDVQAQAAKRAAMLKEQGQ